MHWLTRHRLGLPPKPDAVQSIVLVEAFEEDPPLAASTSGSWAGSWQRIEVMRLRAERGENVFHPFDEKAVEPRLDWKPLEEILAIAAANRERLKTEKLRKKKRKGYTLSSMA